jgi:hypothetical protein
MSFPAGFSAALMLHFEIRETEFETCEYQRCFNVPLVGSCRGTFDLDLIFCETPFVV